MRFTLVILFDALNRRDLSVQREIQNVPAFVGEKAHAIARSYFHT